MNGYFVWDKTDNFLREAKAHPTGMSLFAKSVELAAWQYAIEWGWSYYENDNNSGDYIVHVLPEAVAKMIFEKYPEDQMEDVALSLAQSFRGLPVMTMEPVTLEELEEEE